MTTPPEIVSILNWQRAHAGQVSYSETASTRLASDSAHLASATDCSGMVARMFQHFAGIVVGTYTGNECGYGQLITTSKTNAAAGKGMLPGDVVLFNWGSWNPTWDHIAIYAGGGRIWNHGGPGKGPLDWSLRDNVNSATSVMVRRYFTHTSTPSAPTTDTSQTKELDMDEARLREIVTEVVREVTQAEGVNALHFLDGNTNDPLAKGKPFVWRRLKDFLDATGK